VPENVVYNENSGGKPNLVTSKPEGKSWVGAMHLSGNVWEWCSSIYVPYPYDTQKTESNNYKTNNRVLRGGSWGFYLTNNFRADSRGGDYSNDWNVYRGFRFARSYK
jgi:formylglycine-generating enzyme required for sulfatase activity